MFTFCCSYQLFSTKQVKQQEGPGSALIPLYSLFGPLCSVSFLKFCLHLDALRYSVKIIVCYVTLKENNYKAPNFQDLTDQASVGTSWLVRTYALRNCLCTVSGKHQQQWKFIKFERSSICLNTKQKRFKRLFRQIESIWRLLRCWKGSFSASKCRFSSQPCPVRPSLWKLSLLTPLKMSRPNFKTRKKFLQISNGWCSQGRHSSKTHWKMVALCLITISKMNLLFCWYCVFGSTVVKKKCGHTSNIHIKKK